MKRGRREALEHVCAYGIKRRPSKQQQSLCPETVTKQHHECRRYIKDFVFACLLGWCTHPVFASARRRPAAVPRSAAGKKKTKKANEKAKIHVGERMVIGRQKAVAGPLLNTSHQRASHRRRQVRLLQLPLPQI